jgi:rfaE bifunctional protein nucleotidyltransferase chain/domain
LGHVVSQTELIFRRGQWKAAGSVVVCASGWFDLLHPGHIRLLENARSLGDILVVAVGSDAAIRARSVSGNGSAGNSLARPITPSAERAEILAGLSAVDCVVEFQGVAAVALFARLRPDVVAIGVSAGSEASEQSEAKQFEALGYNVARIPLEPGYSTSRLIDRILKLRA